MWSEFRPMLCLLTLLTILGCSAPGGSEGDKNDPATTTDTAAMSDETGEVSDKKPAKK